MVDDDGDEPQTAIKQLSGGPDHLVHWLTTLFHRGSWQPNGVVIVGADHDLGVLSTRSRRRCRSRRSPSRVQIWLWRVEPHSRQLRAPNSPTPRCSKP